MRNSFFDGRVLSYIGNRLIAFLVTSFSLGILYPWALVIIQKWETSHTIIEGKRLGFDGTAMQLFGNWIKWWFLTVITLGIYSLWLHIKVRQWVTKHTYFVN